MCRRVSEAQLKSEAGRRRSSSHWRFTKTSS
uniref:Uncharacterized protein n=1 Tax=Arundo donax TaxID=35708 RepID=A0A0A8YH51_ARUDO